MPLELKGPSQAAFDARYAIGSIKRWKQKLGTSASTAKVVLVGPSTMDATTSAVSIGNRLKKLHTQQGQALSGMTESNIVMYGNNGQTLLDYLNGNGTNNFAALVAAAPDLIVASWGLNDVRLGQTSLATMTARLRTFVDNCRAALPNVNIVLLIPNPMLSQNVSALNYVTEADGTTIASATTVASYNALLRQAHIALTAAYPDVVVADMQPLFGTNTVYSHPLMGDQLHPTAVVGNNGSVPTGGGYVAVGDFIASVIGLDRGPFPGTESYRTVRKFLVTAGGANFLDLTAFEGSGANAAPAAQFPISTSDKLFVSDYPSSSTANPFTIAGVTARPFGTTNIRLSVTGDFTNYVGKVAYVGAAHLDATTGDRQIVSVDLPSIAAGAIGTTTAAVTGARTGALHDATAVVATPPAAFVSGGLVLLNCYPSANDTVTLVVQNPTAGAVDLAAANWAFWVVR